MKAVFLADHFNSRLFFCNGMNNSIHLYFKDEEKNSNYDGCFVLFFKCPHNILYSMKPAQHYTGMVKDTGLTSQALLTT